MKSTFSKNVIKISSTVETANELPSHNDTTTEYPRVCDFCRDTYNSELTYNRHKETGKCFRFCRLREDHVENKVTKTRRTTLYPRSCQRCNKIYKNKHSFYKHKRRCLSVKRQSENLLAGTGIWMNAEKVDDIKQKTTILEYVDVVELTGDSVNESVNDCNQTNIEYVDNKENINDYDSNFIIALDVDNNYKNFNSLYPRICELCHKLFKCEKDFHCHRANKKCKLTEKDDDKKQEALSFPRRCDYCGKFIRNKRAHEFHQIRCNHESGRNILIVKQPITLAADQNRSKDDEVNDNRDHEISFSEGCLANEVSSSGFSLVYEELGNQPLNKVDVQTPYKRTMYPRQCSICRKTYTRKQTFYHHKKWCKQRSSQKNHIDERIPSKSKSIYPRTCEFCGFVFNTKYSFHRHKRKCPGYTNVGKTGIDALYPRRCNCCSQIFVSHQAYELHRKYLKATVRSYNVSSPKIVKDDHYDCYHYRAYPKITYPRQCESCFQIYSGKQSFCNHKKYCKNWRSQELGLYTSRDSKQSQIAMVAEIEQPMVDENKSNREKKREEEQEGSRIFLDQESEDDKDDLSLYPRTCHFCEKMYARKQSFYHHKRICPGYSEENFVVLTGSSSSSSKKTTYPRICKLCLKTYSSKQSFYIHTKMCSAKNFRQTSSDLFDTDHLDDNQCTLYENALPAPDTLTPSHEELMNLRNKPNELCISAETNINLDENSDNCPQTYPRECENCYGSFPSFRTFAAHKLGCDFFEIKLDDSDSLALRQIKCRTCYSVITKCRSMIRQHFTECCEPAVMNENFVTHMSSEQPVVCECCGEQFDSSYTLRQHLHKQPSITVHSSSIFNHYNVKPPLTLISSINPSIKTYPRFCECCGRIYKTKQTFYNHKKNCHIYCFKYFVQKECENCAQPFKCEKLLAEHAKTCVKFSNDVEIGAECEIRSSTDLQC